MAFDASKLGASFRYTDNSVIVGGGAAVQLAAQNPYRLAIIFQAVTSPIFARPTKPASANVGFQVQTTQPTVFSLALFGAVVQEQWWGFSGAGATMYVLEILQQPQSGE